jgi:hypothetical protein
MLDSMQTIRVMNNNSNSILVVLLFLLSCHFEFLSGIKVGKETQLLREMKMRMMHSLTMISYGSVHWTIILYLLFTGLAFPSNVHNAPRSPDNRARKPPAMGEAPPLC